MIIIITQKCSPDVRKMKSDKSCMHGYADRRQVEIVKLYWNVMMQSTVRLDMQAQSTAADALEYSFRTWRTKTIIQNECSDDILQRKLVQQLSTNNEIHGLSAAIYSKPHIFIAYFSDLQLFHFISH